MAEEYGISTLTSIIERIGDLGENVAGIFADGKVGFDDLSSGIQAGITAVSIAKDVPEGFLEAGDLSEAEFKELGPLCINMAFRIINRLKRAA